MKSIVLRRFIAEQSSIEKLIYSTFVSFLIFGAALNLGAAQLSHAFTDTELYDLFEVTAPAPYVGPFALADGDGDEESSDPRKEFKVYSDDEISAIRSYFEHTFPEVGEPMPFDQFVQTRRIIEQRLGALSDNERTPENRKKVAEEVFNDRRVRREYSEYLVRVQAFKVLENGPHPPTYVRDAISGSEYADGKVARNHRNKDSAAGFDGGMTTNQIEMEARFPEILDALQIMARQDGTPDTDGKKDLQERKEILREHFLFIGRQFLRHRRSNREAGYDVSSMNWHLERMANGYKIIKDILHTNNKQKRNAQWEEHSEAVQGFVESWRVLARTITGRVDLLDAYEKRERLTEVGKEITYRLGFKARRWRDPKKIPEGAFFFGMDVVKFFTAVAITEFYECWQKKDPLICKSFIDSLKHPSTYVGFSIFVGAAHMSGHMIQSLAKAAPGRWGGFIKLFSPLSMAAGSIASNFYHQIIEHPKWKLLMKTSRIRDASRRWEYRLALMQDLFLEETFANGKWWQEQTPSIAGLIVAAQVSGVINSGLRKGTMAIAEKSVGKIVEMSANGSRLAGGLESLGIARAGAAASTLRTSGVGLRVMFHAAGGALRFTFYGMMAWAVFETTVFLFTADFIGVRFDERWKTWESSSRMADLHHEVTKLVQEKVPEERDVWKRLQLDGDPPFGFLNDPVRALQREYDTYRDSLLTEPMMVMSNYRKEREELDKHYRQLENYYSWIASTGANRAAPEWVRNDLGQKPADMKEEDEWQYDAMTWHAADSEKNKEKVLDLTTRLDQVINKEFHESSAAEGRKLTLDEIAIHVSLLAANGGNLADEKVHKIARERLGAEDQKALLAEIKAVETTFGKTVPGYGNTEAYIFMWGLFCGPPPGGWIQRRPVVGEGLLGKLTKEGYNTALPGDVRFKSDLKNQSLFYMGFDSLDNAKYHRFSPECEKVVRNDGNHYNEDYLEEALTMPHYFIPPRIFEERMPGFCENFHRTQFIGGSSQTYEEDIQAGIEYFKKSHPGYESKAQLGSPLPHTLATWGNHIKRQDYIREQFADKDKREAFTKLVINALKVAKNPFLLRQDEIHEKYYQRFAEEMNPLMESHERVDHVNRVNKAMIAIADSLVNVPNEQLDEPFSQIFEFEDNRHDAQEDNVSAVNEAIRFLARRVTQEKQPLGQVDEDEFFDRFKDTFTSALAIVFENEGKSREVRSLDVTRMMRYILIAVNTYHELGEDEAAERALSEYKREMVWHLAFTRAYKIFEDNMNSRFKRDPENSHLVARFVREVMHLSTDGIGSDLAETSAEGLEILKGVRANQAYRIYYRTFAETMDPIFMAHRENDSDRYWTVDGVRHYRHVLDSLEHEFVYWKNMDRAYGKPNQLQIFEIAASQVATKSSAYRFFQEYINSPEAQNYTRVSRQARVQKWQFELLNIPGRMDPTDHAEPYRGSEDDDCADCSGKSSVDQFLDKVELYNSGLDTLEQFLLEKGA